MKSYFPDTDILASLGNIVYSDEWNMCEAEQPSHNDSRTAEISEIYY